MRLDCVRFYKPDIYHPKSDGIELYIKQQRLDKMVVDFNGFDSVREAHLRKLFDMVSHVIGSMSEDEQAKESEAFFVYLISDPRRDIGAYLQPLLSYFHDLGYLKFKKHIYNDNKQKVVRYKVEFKNKSGEIIKVKLYSSLSQLSDDIGKKMTSLHYQLFKV